MSKLTLWISPVSQPSRAVKWFVATHGLDDRVDIKSLDLLKGEASAPEHRDRNPYESVPYLVLDDGKTAICESTAILIYLARRFDVKRDIPQDVAQEAKMWEAIMRHDSQARRITIDFVRKALTLTQQGKSQAEIQAALASDEENLKWNFGILDAKLKQHEFIAGDQWTLADYLAAGEVTQWGDLAPFLPESLRLDAFPNLKRYATVTLPNRPGFDDFVAPWKAVTQMFAPKK